jgi:hypothetical protein
MNMDSNRSAQPCGCDPGAKWTCEWHRNHGKAAATPETAVDDRDCENRNFLDDEEVADPCYAGKTFTTRRPFSEPPIQTVTDEPVPAPTRASTLPENAADRKRYPVATGVLDYFPDALVAIANVSWTGNNQHNPGEPLHWTRGKSMDQDDTIIRHFLQRGTFDTDGLRHSAKMAWRALALLQLEIEASQGQGGL